MIIHSLLRLFLILSLFASIPGSIYPQVTYVKAGQAEAAHSIIPAFKAQHSTASDVPAITAMVSEVNTDTIYQTLHQLQNRGSRFALNDNRKAVATWLMNIFLSYGYTDVKLDSFYCISQYPVADSTMQYNVLCTL